MAKIINPADWLDESTTVCFGFDDDAVVKACAKRECDPDHNQVIWTLNFTYDVNWAFESEFEKPVFASDEGIKAFVTDCFNEMILAAGKIDENAIQAGCNAVKNVIRASWLKAENSHGN